MMAMSIRWWLEYLQSRPATEFSALARRPTIGAWTDASGVVRGLACVIQVGEQVYYSNMTLPDDVWNKFSSRGDHQIGCQEMVAVLLCQWTFARALQGARW